MLFAAHLWRRQCYAVLKGCEKQAGWRLFGFSNAQAKGEMDMKIASVWPVAVVCGCHDKVFTCFQSPTFVQEAS
ncbi:hypothetical protein ADT32_10365 [Xylella fastidiosa]|nr:hypothetical protein BC375_07390 [Xylella fastidiosa]KIA58141.1 hypothetical protein RA12_06335 [Xylella fastidiosa]KXB10105.1 hypothetical protein ADT32_10365 [Xylella fastidiosa]KXB15687.1 hypothetical protein ADT33_04480 [Xylella fastidiosa]KXB17702.1 hypothetical protein ADT31_03940 [Xylella fastidiosa]